MKTKVLAVILSLCVCFGITVPVPLLAAPGEIPRKKIFVGDECSFLIKDDGSLWGWGRNKHGRLGDGTEINRVNPVKIMDDVISYTSNYNKSFAIKTDGSLWGWGDGITGLFDGLQLTPLKLMDDVAQVSGDDGMAAMILKNDGSLWLSGWVSGSYAETRYSPEQIMIGVRYARIDSGVFQVIKDDGSLWIFGDGAYERLGIEGDVSVPIKVMEDAAYVTSDFSITYIVQNDGSLWGFGDNRYGTLKDINGVSSGAMMISEPVKLDDGVSSGIAAYFGGDSPLYYIKKDKSLWKLGNYYSHDSREGIIFGTRPVKVMDNVNYIDSNGFHMFVVQNNGNMWSIGKNEYSQLGDGTTDSKFDSIEVAKVTKTSEAVEALENAIQTMDDSEKELPASINNISRYAEEAAARAANKNVSGSTINIDKAFVTELLNSSIETQIALNDVLIKNGINPNRELDKNISVTTTSENGFIVNVDPAVLDTDIDNIHIRNEKIGIAINRENLESVEPENMLTISTESSVARIPAAGVLVAAKTEERYTIKINSKETPVKVQVPVKEGTVPSQLAAQNQNGEPILSQYNAANSKLEFKPTESGTYALKESVTDFTDIQGLSAEMQNAIHYLTNKNVSFNSDGEKFLPNQIVNRAEIATLLVKAVGRFNANADAGFTDVPKSKWYCGGVGSAYRSGIVSGTSASTFHPENSMLKEQILAVSSRLLKIQRGYKPPSEVDKYFTRFTDNSSINDWAKPDLALAVILDLVAYRSDGRLEPQASMSRADAAMIIYRTFQLIW